MRCIYNLGIALYSLLIRLAAPFNRRASSLVRGRAMVRSQLRDLSLDGPVVWVHCASLGEFEQGRPLIEAIRSEHPHYKIVLTFFSPSGYEVRKSYPEVDLVTYLPADTKRNARNFIKMVQPEKAFFIKYEYWFHYFDELKSNQVPLYLVSAIFRPSQMFFKWYGGWYRKMLNKVAHFFVQDRASADLLMSVGIKNFTVAGDTRFDRVSAIAASAPSIPVVERFTQQGFVLVAGSTWPPDETILAQYMNHADSEIKLIIAPHEVDDSRIEELMKKLKVPAVRFSQINDNLCDSARVLVVDTIGMLSAIYRYGSVSYIGGGFGKGIHNTLEAATYGLPVIFGPNFKRFKEAVDLIEVGGAYAISNQEEFNSVFKSLIGDITDNSLLRKSGEASKKYVGSMCGATELILQTLRW